MLNPQYVVGLVDGEGSFTVYARNPQTNDNRKRRVRVEPKFYLKLVEEDRPILAELQKFFGCGSIYFQKDTRLNHKNCYRYEVYRQDELELIIIPFFRQHPLSLPTKKRDFGIFCRLMKMIKRRDHFSREGLQKIYQVKQLLHSSSRNAGNPPATPRRLVGEPT